MARKPVDMTIYDLACPEDRESWFAQRIGHRYWWVVFREWWDVPFQDVAGYPDSIRGRSEQDWQDFAGWFESWWRLRQGYMYRSFPCVGVLCLKASASVWRDFMRDFPEPAACLKVGEDLEIVRAYVEEA